MTALTPCQKCKADRDAYRERIADLERQVAEHARGAEAYASKSVREVARWAKRYDDLVGLLGRVVVVDGDDTLPPALAREVQSVLNPPGVGPALPAVYQPEDT